VEHDRELLGRLESAPTTELHGSLWRVTYAGMAPARSNVRGARWNPKDVPALYLSTTLECALAEFEYRHEMQPISPSLGWQSHEFRVELNRVLDLSDPSELDGLNLELDSQPEGLGGYGPFQQIGGGAAFLNFEAMVVPSLRFDGTNVVAFTANIDAAGSSELALIASRPVARS